MLPGTRRHRLAARPCASLLTAVLLALAAGFSTGSSARAAGYAASVKPVQTTVTLLHEHAVFSAPRADAAVVEIVQSHRPITLERTVLPLVGRATGKHGMKWLRVLLPGRPNGHAGWISQRKTAITTTNWHLVVHTATRRVFAYRRGRLIRVFAAVVGKPSTPTPHGEFFVEEDVALPPSAVGAPYALALSARSDVLQEFAGGPGQIALHGLENVGGTLGTAASHGCIRLANNVTGWLVHRIGPGVPVTITD
jgi:lipoprotein-anchoring transpeptidase ErfK/SrfK